MRAFASLWRCATAPFTAHPRAVGETYLEHAAFACRYGAKMALEGIAACVHGIFPFLFEATGSRITRELHATLEASAARGAAGGRPPRDQVAS